MNNNPDFNEYIEPVESDTKRARNTVNIIGCTFFVTTALEILAAFLYSFLFPYVAKLTVFIVESVSGLNGDAAKLYAVKILGGAVYTQCVSLVLTLVCFILPFYIVSKYILSLPLGECMSFKGKFMPHSVLIFALAVFVGTYLANFADTAFSLMFPTVHSSQVTDTVELYGSAHTPIELAVMFISLCIIPPIIEEYIFRGVIFKALRKFGFAFAAITSAVMFGLVHANVPQAVIAMVFGFFFAYVTELSGDLRSAMFLHFLNNTVSFVFSYLFPVLLSADDITRISAIYGSAITFFAIAGLVLTVHLETKRQKIKKASADDTEATVGISGFISVGSLIVILIFVYNLL